MAPFGPFSRRSHRIPSNTLQSQSWTTDGQGNFTSITTNGTTQTRTHDQQNELTGVGSTSLTYDAAGNLKTDEQNRTYTYDAWNGLISVSVPNNATSFQAVYTIDPLGRRIAETSGGVTRDLYYSTDWQVLEERVSNVAQTQYVWSPVYVDAMILRDRNADGNSGNGLEERLYVQHDANFNVTALIDASGNVVERYVYDPYGKVTILSPDGSTVRTSSNYGWAYLHQGGRQDSATGLLNFRNRDYSTSLMRWTTNDPIGFGGGDTNTYRYVGNGPGNGLDPSGLKVFREGEAPGNSSNGTQDPNGAGHASDKLGAPDQTQPPVSTIIGPFPPHGGKASISLIWDDKFTEESAIKVLEDKIKEWESEGNDTAAELLKAFIKPGRNQKDKFSAGEIGDYGRGKVVLAVRDFVRGLVGFSDRSNPDKMANWKIVAEDKSNIRWFSSNLALGFGQRAVVSQRNEYWAGTNDNMFYAFGGARLTVQNFRREGGFIRFDAILEDDYQFPKEWAREQFKPYRAAMFLQSLKNNDGKLKYPPLKVRFELSIAMPVNRIY